MQHVLALDQGTTSSRAIVFDRDGGIHGRAQREFDQHFPRAGWVEHDAEEIWTSQLAVAEAALAAAGLQGADIAAIGIANQRETVVIWERASGEPIHRAIVWQDRRTAERCDRLAADGHGPRIRELTGLVIDPYFSGTKVEWLLDRVPGARERALAGELAFGTIDSWLLWKLTGGRHHATDATNASRTMLWDLRTGEWSEELLGLLRVPRAVLPEVRDTSEVYGQVEVPGPLQGLPIGSLVGDQQAALAGQACLGPGQAKNTYGTGCFALVNTGQEAHTSRHQLLTTVAWRRDGRTLYALEGSVFSAGAVVQWLRDGLGLISSSDEVEALARSVPDSDGVFLVPAFTGLGAPHWDPYARGTLIGLTRGTGAGHIARAALEGIAFQVADLLDAMVADAGAAPAELRVDGGAAVNDTLLQFQADVLGLPLVRPVVTETTALGAAYLAGLATGLWRDPQELADRWRAERRFEPRLPAQRVAELRGRWCEALARSRGWEPAGETKS